VQLDLGLDARLQQTADVDAPGSSSHSEWSSCRHGPRSAPTPRTRAKWRDW
jgi:hypothetical protein